MNGAQADAEGRFRIGGRVPEGPLDRAEPTGVEAERHLARDVQRRKCFRRGRAEHGPRRLGIAEGAAFAVEALGAAEIACHATWRI